MENGSKPKKSKGLIATVVILILIIIGLCTYIAYDKGVIFKNKADVEEKEKKKTKKENKEEKVKEEEIKELDLTKSLNTTNTVYTNPSDVEGNYGLSMQINSDKKSVTLSINWPTFGPLSGASAYSEGTENYQITGFTKNIVSTFVGDRGQDAMGITLFFIMDDQTVEYMPMFNNNNGYYQMSYVYENDASGRITGEHFETKGMLNGVQNAYKLYSANANSGNIGGGRTTIAARKDGSFYDLGAIIG